MKVNVYISCEKVVDSDENFSTENPLLVFLDMG